MHLLPCLLLGHRTLSFFTASFSFISLRAINVTSAPKAASSIAEANPRPCVLPHTSAFFPDKLRFIFIKVKIKLSNNLSNEIEAEKYYVKCILHYRENSSRVATQKRNPLRNRYFLLFSAVRKIFRRILTGVYNIQKLVFFSLAIFDEMHTLHGFPANIIILKEVFVKLSTETGEEKLK